jgi:two-component system invasion response regulator UvrY
MANIILLDDHNIVRQGLKELIEKLGPFKVSQEFDNGVDFLISFTQKQETDLIILDLSMPGMKGDEVMEKLNKKEVKTPVLILTMSEDEAMIIKLFRLGIKGYLRKSCSAEELRNAINEIFTTGYCQNEYLTYSLQTNLEEKKKKELEHILEQITPRERQFLKLVCHEKEYTYPQIAEEMSVELRTVDGYRDSIFKKFGIHSKTGLVLFVLRNKLLEHF